MNLTKDRITGLCDRVTGSAMSDEDKETMRELAEYWKSQQPKVQRRCVHCGEKLKDHWFGMGICLGGKTKYEE